MYRLEIKGIDKLEQAFRRSPEVVGKEVRNTMDITVNFIRPFMRKEAPRRSGKLSRNIQAHVKRAGSGAIRGSIGPNLAVTPYALYVHRGTGIYGPFGQRIIPTKKKALYWKGAPHPVRSTKGQKANPFVKRTFNEIQQPIMRIWQDMIKRVTSDFSK